MTTSPYTLEDLQTPEGSSVIRARLMAALLADGQPTASWAPSSAGGVENLRADMVAGGLAFYMAERIAALVNGRLLPFATDSATNGYFLTYLGKRFYKLTKRGATSTIQNIALTTVASGASKTFKNGDLIVSSPATGNRYLLYLPDGSTVQTQPGATVNAPFRAENPGSTYIDPDGTVTRMVTATPGVTCTNARATDFTPVRVIGTSSGGVIGFFADPATPPGYNSVRIRIDSSGDIGTATFSYSTDGGASWTAGGPIPGGLNVIFPGSVLGFTNGSTPSFVAGDILTLRVNDSFLQRGADAETDEAFRARCSNRYPARSLIPLRAHIELWAQAASAEVAKITSDADRNIPGGILVTIASATGPATAQAQQDVEDFINARLNGFKGVPAPTTPTVPGSTSPEEICQASSALKEEIAVAGTVIVPAAALAAAQAGIDQAWDVYLGSLPLGGDPLAIVELERFYTIAGELGAEDVQGLTFNAVAADFVITTGRVAVPKAGKTLRASLTWVAV
jgi:hypothetical protein